MNFLNITLIFLSALSGSPVRYPIPTKSEGHLFYIQRTHNTNTVVYEANFDTNGNLNPDMPIKIHWVLYEEGSVIEPLTRLENRFAFGVKHKLVENNSQEYDIQLVSYKKLKLRLKQTAPFKAEIFQGEGQIASSLDHIFVIANDAGLWTKVKYLEVYTHIPKSENLKQEKIEVN
ncbi:DUF4833 domain-containing protein [Ancylomarina euxinus]|uniref:DUF4833 domain-containing protein n=1 Tax=Ancylomarina euxinus TaxID=2283627 RepID=A0A425Y037_9BACT|nr:DUF4833 domain-containing protein [Ancylomarina euxinus]MCZ4695191.1 DUF4833 domain-containing protein [Ancylomarina euxinus]MUP15388.1 DUF4833 domain-containing protein [Ancylomarina euxinus]RRG21098.1 DUF4833 domain-containing protein [Ancylomarina euxinus]